MRKILLTGFEPFGTTPINPAEKVARALSGSVLGDARVVSRIVENSFGRATEQVERAMVEEAPDIVLMLGEYGGRAMVTLERFAHNHDDSARYGLADNAGITRYGSEVVPGGPVAYRATLPLHAMTRALRSAGVPADISDTGGTNVCNHLLYGILHRIETGRLPIRAGWMHLPHLPEVAALDSHLGAPSMALDTAIRGVSVAIETALARTSDDADPPRSAWQI